MARLAKLEPVEAEEGSDGELPQLLTLLKGTTRNNTAQAPRPHSNMKLPERRTSPRRGGAGTAPLHVDHKAEAATSKTLNSNRGISATSLLASTITLPPPVSPTKKSPAKRSPAKATAKSDIQKSPVKRSHHPNSIIERDSGAATSMLQRQRPLKLAHVNSLLLPPTQVASRRNGSEEVSDAGLSRPKANEKVNAKPRLEVGAMAKLPAIDEVCSIGNFDSKNVVNGRERNARRASPKRAAKEKANYLSQFILKEARCNDDSSESGVDNDEEELTDLSGFIVDDDAELSFHGSDSDPNGDFDAEIVKPRSKEPSRKRRLQRTRPEARAMMESENEDYLTEKEDIGIRHVVHDLFSLKLGAPTNEKRRTQKTEVIDLTYSPPKIQADRKLKSEPVAGKKANPSPAKRSSSDKNPFLSDENDHSLKFSPPLFESPAKIQENASEGDAITTAICSPLSKPSALDTTQQVHIYTTPPTTPPASPTKLKSPSKLLLLSPSKRGAAIPTSPHRQSIDAFWCANEINSWNDQYSPHKPPLTVSPKKRGLARLLDFDIWSDSDTNEDAEVSRDEKINTSSSSDPPTPTRSSSPSKTQESPSKLSITSKKALAEAKRVFEATRHATAQSLLTHLDTHITSGKLFTLSASTGGVRILWSKNLRSTAGRANWRRTVTKPPPRPSGSLTAGSEPKPVIQHYASIELAVKVIDSDSRLVNTLAHEFCHLANFMVSGVRDQPHGASFKAWADKVTKHLRTAPDLSELYRSVEVTTKHSYVINHKYLWVCAGQTALSGSAQAAARAFLALEDDPGCGAEYGRHSKSIDPEKHRCGKCKGLLVQARPMPKLKRGKAGLELRSPRKGNGASRANQQGGLGESKERHDGGDDQNLGGLEKALEYVILSD